MLHRWLRRRAPGESTFLPFEGAFELASPSLAAVGHADCPPTYDLSELPPWESVVGLDGAGGASSLGCPLPATPPPHHPTTSLAAPPAPGRAPRNAWPLQLPPFFLH